jgi:hypothetical protein
LTRAPIPNTEKKKISMRLDVHPTLAIGVAASPGSAVTWTAIPNLPFVREAAGSALDAVDGAARRSAFPFGDVSCGFLIVLLRCFCQSRSIESQYDQLDLL